MALEGYSGAKEVQLTESEASGFEFGFDLIKDAVRKAGFSDEALALLDFKATAHTLTIPPEESGLGGAFHTHADGKPFYTVTVSAPDALTELAYGSAGKTPTELSTKAQAFYVAFEIGNNVSRVMQPVLTQHYGMKDPDGLLTSGATMSMGDPYTVELPMRCDPLMYTMAMAAVLDMRLQQLVQQKPDASTQPANKQNPPQGPKL